MQYFSMAEAAQRYERYRPKVHRIVVQWLADACGPRRFADAIDIACGTGDSTLPLTQLADRVRGIDSSEEMLIYARQKRLAVRCSSYADLNERNHYDLISTCMAFHWFDAPAAIAKYKQISRDGAIWLIYNFAFAGHESSEPFNAWFRDQYLKTYPSPPRGKTSGAIPKNDPELSVLREGSGCLPLNFSTAELAGYLSTQSNIEHAVRQGASYEKIVAGLEAAITAIAPVGSYRYIYTYGVYRYGKIGDRRRAL